MHICRRFLLFTLALVALPALAQTPAASTQKRITEALRFIDKPIQKLRPTPYAGFWEVTIDGKVVYVLPDASHLFIGSVIDARTNKDLTEHRAEPFPGYPPAASGATEEKVGKDLMLRLKDPIAAPTISATAIPGLWEAVAGGTDVFYVNQAVDYIFFGELLALPSRNNLTKARLRQLESIDFASLPFKDALLLRQGSGARKLVVFADPMDIYSQRLQSEMEKIGDVTVYVFIYPFLTPESMDKARDIVCASAPAEAWMAWMLKKRAPPAAAASCDSTVLDRNMVLSQRNRINASPVLVLQDSTRHNGTLPAADLEKLLTTTSK